MNDQNSGDGRQIQPPPGWPGTGAGRPEQDGEPHPGQAQPGQAQPGQAQPGQAQPDQPPQGYPGYPPAGYPAPGQGAPGQYGPPGGAPGQPGPPYGYQPYGPQYGDPRYANQRYANQPYGQPYGDQQYGNQQYGNQQYGNQPYGNAAYGTGQYGTGQYGAASPPATRTSRLGLKTVLVLVILAALGGGGYLAHRSGVLAPLLSGLSAQPGAPGGSGSPDAGIPAATEGSEEDGGFGAAQPGESTTVPGCPFTADQITAMVGQPMVDKGGCLFGDGKGVAQLGIEVHSASSTAATVDYARQQANNQYLLVEDLKTGEKGFVAYKNTSAQAMTVTAQGGYTVTMSNFERFNGFTYEAPLTAVIGALPR